MRSEIEERKKRGCSDILSDYLYHRGPTAFSPEEIRAQPHLFAHRGALFYTPTENLPHEYVGSGTLDVRLTVPTPDYLELQELRGYAIPRVWVDLLQRATQRIRWSPVHRAKVVFTRYDQYLLRDDHLAIGMKALRDALKATTTGREDARLLYYFGAIYDDDANSAHFEYVQTRVDNPRDCGTRIQVLGGTEGGA